MKGRGGAGREWVYWWYDPKPGHDKARFKRARFVRDRKFKLYDDGRFFDVERDGMEERAMEAGSGGGTADRARSRLGAVLEAMRAQERPGG